MKSQQVNEWRKIFEPPPTWVIKWTLIIGAVMGVILGLMGVTLEEFNQILRDWVERVSW